MTENKNQLHIEHNTVQETLVIPLYARKVCSDRYPQFFRDEEAERLISMLDYDFAAGVFYYFKTEEIKALLTAMAERFPGAVIAFDACNERGLKMMLKTWVKEAGITDVGAFFSVRDAKAELAGWSDRFASVTSRGYMKGYRDLGKAIPWLYRRMCSLCDGFISMQIVRIAFAE
jgi:O-methyltransferase involved in polyketide biosynthesis